MSRRKINREEVTRYGVDRHGHHFKIVKSWHFLNDGETKFCYIHVSRAGYVLPFRWWRWIEFPDGTWEWAP